MKVTAIKAQVKREGRYSIFVDGKYAFSLSAESLLDSGLINGQELSETDIQVYLKLSTDDKAYGLTLEYIVRRMRSEGELQDYFRRKKYESELAEQIIAKLTRGGYVDDAEFARRWVENRRLMKATSARRLQLELQQKKVSSDIIQTVLEEDETDERQVLHELLAKKRKQARYQDNQKLIAYLARQGFNYDDIKSALESEEV